jgi:hypothetical protein
MGWKIVRDRHQERLRTQISGQWRTSPDPISALIKKLGEEYGELCENRDPAELFDIRDALSELILQMDPLGYAEDKHNLKIKRLGVFSTHLEWQPNAHLITWEQAETEEARK